MNHYNPTFIQSHHVISSPIPLNTSPSYQAKHNKAFYLNLSSDFNFTASAKSKENSFTATVNPITNSNDKKYRYLNLSNHKSPHYKPLITPHLIHSRLDTKESTNPKAFLQIPEEEVQSTSNMTNSSVSFSAFIIPENDLKSRNTKQIHMKNFSSLCHGITLKNKLKRQTAPQKKKLIKTTQERVLEKMTREREELKKLKKTNDIMKDKLEKYKSTETQMQGSMRTTSWNNNNNVKGTNDKTKIIVKPFKLTINQYIRKRRIEMHCCACDAPMTKKKNETEMDKNIGDIMIKMKIDKTKISKTTTCKKRNKTMIEYNTLTKTKIIDRSRNKTPNNY